MNKEEIRSGFTWLQHNGYEDDVKSFLHEIKVLIQKAIDKNFSELNGIHWERRIERACKKMAALNKCFFEANGEYFVRKYDRLDKNDMSEFICEIVKCIIWD